MLYFRNIFEFHIYIRRNYSAVFGSLSKFLKNIEMATISSVEGWSNKSLAKGAPKPACNGDKIRVYSMRFCPYAHRALIVLSAKNLPFDVVNINTREKPEWFSEINPTGTVPAVQFKDKIVYESLIVAEWIDETFDGDKKIQPKDPFKKAQQKILLERFQKVGMATFQYYQNQSDPAIVKTIEECVDFFEKSLVNNEYFAGSEPEWVDYMIWPWLERMAAVAILSDGKLAVTASKHPKLAAYIDRMTKRPEIQKVWQDGHKHLEFFRGYVTGTPQFDIGL